MGVSGQFIKSTRVGDGGKMSVPGQQQTSAPARKWSAVCGGADVPSRGQGWGQHRYPGPRQRLAGKAIRLIGKKRGRFAG